MNLWGVALGLQKNSDLGRVNKVQTGGDKGKKRLLAQLGFAAGLLKSVGALQEKGVINECQTRGNEHGMVGFAVDNKSQWRRQKNGGKEKSMRWSRHKESLKTGLSSKNTARRKEGRNQRYPPKRTNTGTESGESMCS